MTDQSERTRQVLAKLETFVFVSFYTLVFIKFSQALFAQPNVANAVYLFDQTLILFFLLFRRPARLVTERPMDFVVSTAGTILPMLAVPHSSASMIPVLLVDALMIVGLLTHLGAKLSLRRSFGVIPADRGVITGGIYRFVRHPMYLGYMIVEVGLFLAGPNLWNGAVFACHWGLLIYRMQAEERVLKNNPDYRAYCLTTRYRLIPGVY